MKTTDLKYLAAFSIPVTAIIGLLLGDYCVFFTPIFAFVLMPIMELILPIKTRNLSEEEATAKKESPFFDFLLYLNVPILFGLIIWFLSSLTTANYTTFELVGLTFSIGIVVGSNGINVAHELGHRTTRFDKTLSKLLLMPALYMHFYIEHNFGHHVNAATAEDPASAKYNQTVYAFWIQSMVYQYGSAWKLQHKLLKSGNHSFFSSKNDMLWYVLIQALYLVVLFITFGLVGMLLGIAIALTGAILLETINYIEHYGLRRNKKESGRYERVSEIHSWNSNHVLGRVMLYELTRHSDHHYRAHKEYQLLDYHDISPQMPYGYPTSMVLSLVPPLWFAIMNKRIPAEMKL